MITIHFISIRIRRGAANINFKKYQRVWGWWRLWNNSHINNWLVIFHCHFFSNENLTEKKSKKGGSGWFRVHLFCFNSFHINFFQVAKLLSSFLIIDFLSIFIFCCCWTLNHLFISWQSSRTQFNCTQDLFHLLLVLFFYYCNCFYEKYTHIHTHIFFPFTLLAPYNSFLYIFRLNSPLSFIDGEKKKHSIALAAAEEEGKKHVYQQTQLRICIILFFILSHIQSFPSYKFLQFLYRFLCVYFANNIPHTTLLLFYITFLLSSLECCYFFIM